jgi:predicted DNA-binding transcriptional regulator AlpA
MSFDVSELVTKADVARLLEVSRERVSQLAGRDDFPAALGRVGKSLVWSRADVERWAEGWARRSGRPPRAAAAPSSEAR